MAPSKDMFTTVAEGEPEKHSKLRNVWWNRLGCCGSLHNLNYRRIPYIRDGLVSKLEIRNSSKPLANMKILDVGCGGGILSEGLAKIGAVVTGIDPCQELIDVAIEHSSIFSEVAENRPTYYRSTVEEHAQEYRNYYDAVVASEVIDHVVNKDLFLKQCIETLKPGGKIFITAPNKTSAAKYLGVYMAENVYKSAAKGIHDYEKFITPEHVTSILEKNNCEVNNTYGLIYWPCLKIWQWVFFQSIWYALEATKLD